MSTGEATLRITPLQGDIVYWEVGGDATPSSSRVENLHTFIANEMQVSFLCVDSTQVHEQGAAKVWKNKVSLKKFVQDIDTKTKSIELRSPLQVL